MKLTIRLVVLLAFVAALGLAAMPAAANMTGSTLVSIDPGTVESSATFDITFTVYADTDDLEWMDLFAITLPSSWTINAITPNTGGSCDSDGVANISGQTLSWADPNQNDGCGPYHAPDPHTFVANVTTGTCDGAPWDLDWHISGDEWFASDPPHDVYGTYSVGCGDIAAEPVPGCDATINIPSSAVGASMIADAPVYWKPGEITEHVLPEGTHVRAIGLDASGAYYQVLYVCDFLWVPASVVGKNYEYPWNGAELPTAVIDVPDSSSK